MTYIQTNPFQTQTQLLLTIILQKREYNDVNHVPVAMGVEPISLPQLTTTSELPTWTKDVSMTLNVGLIGYITTLQYKHYNKVKIVFVTS